MKTLREKIIDAIYKIVTGKERIRLILTPIVGFVFFCVILLLIFAAFFLDRSLGFQKFISLPLSAAVSLPFMLIGAFLGLWSAGKFLMTKGTPVPINPPPKLVTDGPYAYSRNPMLTGLFIFIAGIGILFGSITLTFIMTPLFMVFAILEFKNIEEPELIKRFGKEYEEYRKRTPIIIPKFRR